MLVFHGDGNIQDFPGNYTQFRDYLLAQPTDKTTAKTKQGKENGDGQSRQNKAATDSRPRKKTYKERLEFEQLEKDIEALETEQGQIVEALSSGTLAVEEITRMSKRLPLLKNEIDEKSIRWLELSELA